MTEIHKESAKEKLENLIIPNQETLERKIEIDPKISSEE